MRKRIIFTALLMASATANAQETKCPPGQIRITMTVGSVVICATTPGAQCPLTWATEQVCLPLNPSLPPPAPPVAIGAPPEK